MYIRAAATATETPGGTGHAVELGALDLPEAPVSGDIDGEVDGLLR